jgi:hypothetical protein
VRALESVPKAPVMVETKARAIAPKAQVLESAPKALVTVATKVRAQAQEMEKAPKVWVTG